MVPPQARHVVESSHPNKVRMLVLETDDPHPDTRNEQGGFGDILGELFKKAGNEHEPSLGVETVIQYVIEDNGGSVPKFEDITDDIHAILITGSVYDAHGNDEWILKLMELIKYNWIHHPDIRFTGICFGHQILCRVLGSEVIPEPNGEWEISHTPIHISDVGRKLFNLPSTEKKIYLHQMHLDYVVAPPKHGEQTKQLLTPDMKIHVWGKSGHTGVQGVYINRRLFTSQGHMEFNEAMVKRQLEMRVKSGSLNKEHANEATERADWLHDGLLVAKAVLRFFHGDDDKVE